MKKFITFIICITFVTYDVTAQIIDNQTDSDQNYLPVEGDRIYMKIDTSTPLNKLIDRLNGNWEFIETGKGYWIGYTNDMFSIAARGDNAINELIDFFHTTKSKNGKIGAIYTIHLIGINRTIVGRTSEKFLNPLARKALLNLLNEENLNSIERKKVGFMEESTLSYQIMELLSRDPWPSDIPYLFDLLEKKTDEEIIWPILNFLKWYEIHDYLPYNNHQEIPEDFNILSIVFPVKDEKSLSLDFDFSSQAREALKIFKKKFPDIIEIENVILKNKENILKFTNTKLSNNTNIDDLTSHIGMSTIKYYFEKGKIYFFTIKTAQNRTVSWWQNLSEEEKKKFQ